MPTCRHSEKYIIDYNRNNLKSITFSTVNIGPFQILSVTHPDANMYNITLLFYNTYYVYVAV